MYDLIIIGLGPAGLNACIYAKRSNLNVLVIERGMPGGTLHNIKDIENYLGYEHITGSDLAIKFYKQFKDLNIPHVTEEVENIFNNKDYKEVVTNKNTYQAKSIIIATGRGPLKLGLENEKLPGISYCTLCDGSLYKDKIVTLYGNGPKNLEDAIYLSGIAQKVYFVYNQNDLLGPKDLILKVKALDNIVLMPNEEITEIIGEKILEKVKLKVNYLETNALFINNGYGPITYFAKDLGITDEHGYIIVDNRQETNIKGIFACGDNTKKDIYQIITAASEGASSAINAYKYIKDI